ncbi:MAG: MBL fold metallo-hydrolase [Planctomycetaceae bacterium]
MDAADDDPFVMVLGTAQDAGYPQAGCRKACCKPALTDPSLRRFATSLAIVDPNTDQRWLLDCTPDFREQLQLLDRESPLSKPGLDGILLTHAHIGHYSGLVHLGREAMGTKAVPVFAMPRMQKFLRENGPWSQLVKLQNIEIKPLINKQQIQLNDRISVTPLQVPHRDEFSETVGFVVQGPSRSILFLPDIDKWNKWKTPIEKVLKSVDLAYVDGTFFANGEIPGRDMSLIPHPFIEESLARFAKIPKADRAQIRFIHLNHTNPALDANSAATRSIESIGLKVATQGERESL